MAYCAALEAGTYDDWYLPSKYDLNLMYENRVAINTTATNNGGDAFKNSPYWSTSAGRDASAAFFQSFGNGFQFYNNKYVTYYVRAVRAF
jgi:hypothetical protein